MGQALDEIGFDDELPCDCTVSDLSQIFAMKKGKRHAAATMKRILELSLVAGIFGWFKKHKQEGKKLVKSGSAVAQESKRRATDAQTNISNVS